MHKQSFFFKSVKTLTDYHIKYKYTQHFSNVYQSFYKEDPMVIARYIKIYTTFLYYPNFIDRLEHLAL